MIFFHNLLVSLPVIFMEFLLQVFFFNYSLSFSLSFLQSIWRLFLDKLILTSLSLFSLLSLPFSPLPFPFLFPLLFLLFLSFVSFVFLSYTGYDNEKPQNKKQAKAPFSLPGLTLAQVSTFNSKTMRAYTKICYNKAMTISNSASIRSMSVSNFVMSPGSSHNDVISLIKELSASIALGKEEAEKEKEREKEREKKKEKETKTETETETEKEKEEEKKETVVVDRSAELLLESVILSVFQTDAAWFVLEHLLSMEVIGGSNQRTTANILQNLKLWVPIEKIVAILKVFFFLFFFVFFFFWCFFFLVFDLFYFIY